jgi:hypothetical protein
MGSLLILLLIGVTTWALWHQAGLHHRARRQQLELLDLQRDYIRLAHRQARVAERALARDERVLQIQELESLWRADDGPDTRSL